MKSVNQRQWDTVQLSSPNHPPPWPQLFTDVSQLLYMPSIKCIENPYGFDCFSLLAKQKYRGIAQLKLS